MRIEHETEMVIVNNWLNAKDWLVSSASTAIEEDDAARAKCRYPENVEILCGIIANSIPRLSPSQVYVAGITYSNTENRITELDKMRKLRSHVINSGNKSAQKYIILERHKKRLFDGEIRTFRVERSFRDKMSGFAGNANIFTSDIYLIRWWCWLFDLIESDKNLSILKEDRDVKKGLEHIQYIKEDLNDEIKLWEKFLE